MLRIDISISNTELGVIPLSVIQKGGYHHATDDQEKAVQAFVLVKDVFYKQRATVHHEALGLHELNKELECHG